MTINFHFSPSDVLKIYMLFKLKKILDLGASLLLGPSQCFTLQTSSKEQSVLVVKEDARIFNYLSALGKDSVPIQTSYAEADSLVQERILRISYN